MNPTIDPELLFYLGQSYQLWSDFEKAIVYYEKYRNSIDDNDKKQQKYIAKKIEECQTGILLVSTPVRVWVDNLGDSINSKYSEFSPVISADNKVLFYTARKPDSKGGKIDRSGKYYEDIYYSVRDFEEDWHAGKNIGAPINTESHDATVGIAPDGKSVFTYQGINAKNGDILITRQLDDGTWETPMPIGEGVNSKYHESSASLSFDEQTLFYVSNKPDGYGQHDIYVSQWDVDKKEWKAGKNLGPIINTEYEEKGVFYHSDSRTLYFSSDGHKNMGGLDVFKTFCDEKTDSWSTPENLGHPVNTPDDDIYLVVTGNTRYAYYSSGRPGGYGEKDIYKITFLGPAKNPVIATLENEAIAFKHSKADLKPLSIDEPKILLSVQLIDAEEEEGIPGQVFIVDSETKDTVTIETQPDGSFATLLDPDKAYSVGAVGDGFQFTSKSLTRELSRDAYQELEFVLLPLNIDQPKILLSGQIMGKEGEGGFPGTIIIIDPASSDTLNVIDTKDDGSFSVLLDVDKDYSVGAVSEGFQFKSQSLRTDLNMNGYI